MMHTENYSETFAAFYHQTKRRTIAKGSILHTLCRDNLKSYTLVTSGQFYDALSN
jgi:hypothetical protein